jgi:hypothetical protein
MLFSNILIGISVFFETRQKISNIFEFTMSTGIFPYREVTLGVAEALEERPFRASQHV